MRYALMLFALLADVAGAATFTVDTTSDANLLVCSAAPGDCSLRGAINAANATTAADTVAFDIPSTDPGCVAATGVCRIAPSTGLSSIFTGDLTIDGYTQPGAVPNTNTPAQGGSNAQLKIVLTGASCPGCSSGISYFTTSGTVRGLVINGFSAAAIDFAGRATVVGNVEGCFLGTDVTGTIAVPNGLGVSTGGNPFGGDFSSNARIGGSLPAQRNVISGQSGDGISGGGANLRILGNLIGTNAAGTAALGNGFGVRLFGGTGFFQILGGADVASRNVISGNGRGVVIAGAGPTNGTRVIGNFIGTDVTGTLPLGNGILGIELSTGVNGAQPPLVGGTLPGEGNVIAFNGTQGVATRRTRGAVISNRIHGNGQLGISGRTSDNGTAGGRLPNDPGDPDNPSNNGQNFPEISAYAVVGGNVNLSYRVDSTTTNSAYPLRVEFFKADGDEGRDLIGFDNYLAAEAQTVKAISLLIPSGLTLSADDVIVATATDAQGNTSEFSFGPVVLTVNDSPDPHPAGLPFMVDVEALATAGPFKPNGVVDVSMDSTPAATCTIALEPRVPANTGGGSCILIAPQAGARTITASYRTFRGAFGSATGGDVVATTPHTATAPGPEQVGFTRCRQRVVEGEVAQVRVTRNSGGVVAVGASLAHSAGTATPGVDYTVPPNQVLSWAAGDFAPKLINIPIAADAPIETIERFRLTLSDPVSTAILPFAQLDIEIMDGLDDVRFGNSFEPPDCLP